MLNSGYMKYIDLPDPPSGAYRLPPHVQQVPRVYAEACLRTIASFEVLTCRQAIAAHAPAPSVPQGIGSGRPVQGSRATPSTSGQDAVVSSGVNADDDEDDDKEETGSKEEDVCEGGNISSKYLGSEDTDYVALTDMTQKTSRKQPRQDTTLKSPPKRPRKK
ncbi:uncharacterized protein LOC131323080 [Rhododendron vialii]|uniref:uncharacterized protein LOC131323080 n=1 Tax=Rhododendron vialii TaxID=182163 RepID=UPI00265E72F2|nr:uncharacterized protein LOC131323080 [Rhododendron vialii]